MAEAQDIMDSEVTLNMKISRFFNDNSMDLIFDVKEIEVSINDANDLCDRYQQLHLKLKRTLGEEVYGTGNFQGKLDVEVRKFMDWNKEAKAEVRRLKLHASDKLEREEKEKEERLAIRSKAKNMAIKEEELHRQKILDEISIMYEQKSTFPEDIQSNISIIRSMKENYIEIFMRVDDFDDELNDHRKLFAGLDTEINTFMKNMMVRIQNMRSARARSKAEADQLEQNRRDEELTKSENEKVQSCKILYVTICDRFQILESLCSTNIKVMSNTQVLRKHDDIKQLDSDFTDLLDRITQLGQLNPSDFLEIAGYMNELLKRKSNLQTSISFYKKSLDDEVSERDLSEDKMKNASLLGIDLPTFKGYDSTVDYYTFKLDFEKLVTPRYAKPLLPELLKKNYLKGQALEIVKEVHNLEEIWERLEQSFGNVSVLLTTKLREVDNTVPLQKIRQDEKLIQAITKLRNCMSELKKLAEKHDIEASLYHSSNIAKFFQLLGDRRHKEITKRLMKQHGKPSCADEWEAIMEHLEQESKVTEAVLLHKQSSSVTTPNPNVPGAHNVQPGSNESRKKCKICDKTDHVPTLTSRGKLVINYFSCRKFATMTTKEKFEEIKRKRFCFQCLTPGMKLNHPGFCFDKFKCPHESHQRNDRGVHVMICDKHKDNQENVELFETYKTKYITNASNPLPDYSRNMVLHCYRADSVDEEEVAIYMFQTIKQEGRNINLFYDTGCRDSVSQKSTVDFLKGKGLAIQERKGPLPLYGVGDKKSICPHGRYQVTLTLADGSDAKISGICLDKITTTFPKFPLKDVENEFQQAFEASGGVPGLESLPKLPKFVGGDTNLMLGVQFLKYFPVLKLRLPNGLSIYESQFSNVDGSRGVVCGPHKCFAAVYHSLGESSIAMSAYLTEVAQNYRDGWILGLEVPLLGDEEMKDDDLWEEGDTSDDESLKTGSIIEIPSESMEFDDEMSTSNEEGNSRELHHNEDSNIPGAHVVRKPPKAWKKFLEVDKSGTEVSYRCPRCRDCKECKCGEQIEYISLIDEVHQSLINKSVEVNLEKGEVVAKLPFLSDPVKKLKSNKSIAMKIYYAQIKKLGINPEDKADVILAEKKLSDLGFVDSIENLTDKQRKGIFDSALQYFIPWRAVWNSNSLTTPCRPVFDATVPTETGLGLNDIVAKGSNNMNFLVQVFIRWTIRRCGFHTDIQKMYNTIKLHEDHWKYQLYLWQKNLDPRFEPLIKVIKTLIYGVKPSGNQAERRLREAANMQKDAYPRQAEIVNDDFYVDDCVSGEDNYEVAKQVTDDLALVIGKAGFLFKGITFTGFDPPDNLSNPDKSVNVFGGKWFPKQDLLSLNLSELNFGKASRGKKDPKLRGIIPDKFTRSDCAGKVGEIFDLGGKLVPLIASFKMDLSILTRRKLMWDDDIPEDLLSTWKSNFEVMKQLGNLKYRRCVVPEDALNLDMETIEMADASLEMACSVVYARFKRKNGQYSCQLIFARSKTVPTDMTIPRAELLAAILNASTGHTSFNSLKDFITKRIHVTDSLVVLSWLNNVERGLNLYVRNRVIEVNRLTDIHRWYHVGSKNMLADIGTRKGVTIADVSDDSEWINGQDWMNGDESTFPMKSFREAVLSKNDLDQYKTELIKSDVQDDEWVRQQLSYMYCHYNRGDGDTLLSEVAKRYKFSRYLIDPNRFRFKKVVRVLGLVILFVKKLLSKRNRSLKMFQICDQSLPNQFQFSGDKYLVTQGTFDSPYKCKKGLTVQLTEEILLLSLQYYYHKATMEVKEFVPRNSYKNISVEKNGILYYSGRILPTQKVTNKLNLVDVCLDLDMTTFFVPIVDKHSPLAYALVNEIHWYSDEARHSGNETVSRQVQKVAHIIDGRGIVSQFRKECARCRYLLKKAVDIAMGPISDDQLKIAPPFYISQVDIFGPLKSHSNVNKRATTKIWFVVFCCCVTGAIDVRLCEDYSANSFILAFIRFSCKVGYPRKLLPDPGSQLIKGCESMTISFSNVSNVLHEYGVSYELCPVGAHYMHGKVERKIRHIKESFSKILQNERLSNIQWETLGEQVANAINNLPIAIGNVTQDLENIDLLTPNRLMLARNNNRCPVGPLKVSGDLVQIVEGNNQLMDAWFKAWLTSYVPSLVFQPKWFNSDTNPKIGDVVLFLKSEKEFDKHYQYGIISDVQKTRDGRIRKLEIEYMNHNEKTRRKTTRASRHVVVIHPLGELGIIRECNRISDNLNKKVRFECD